MKGINFNISCIALLTSYNPNVSSFCRLTFRLLLQAGVTVCVLQHFTPRLAISVEPRVCVRVNIAHGVRPFKIKCLFCWFI